MYKAIRFALCLHVGEFIRRTGGLSPTICWFFLFIQFHSVFSSAIMGDGHMTVDKFLKLAGRARNKRHSSRPGYEFDHVVELQLVVAAAEGTRYTREGWRGELVDFFNEESNLKERPEEENQAKGEAVRRLILSKREGQSQRMQPEPEDAKYIREVRKKWGDSKEHLDGQFDTFKKRMDDLLS